MSSKYPRCISIRGELYKQLQAHAKVSGVPMSKIVESLVLSAVNDDAPLPSRPRPVREVRPSAMVEIEVSQGIFDLVDDQVVRARERARELAGQTLTHAALLEQAIGAALAAEGA